jgi:lysyl-tRNA synthetase, class II
MGKDLKSNLIGQRKVRLEKLNKIRSLGINPYPAKSFRDIRIEQVKKDFSKYEGKVHIVVGRIMAWRTHGKLVFADIKDQTGSIQIIIKKDSLESSKEFLNWENLELLDLADFIEVKGQISRSKTEEISVLVQSIRLLSKALRPIPRKLKNKEQKFRRRYLDLVINPESIKLFERKAKFWKIQREFLQKEGFIEVEVPVLEIVTGGADAKPFITHHNALDIDLYLRISTELYQKRLIGGGLEKIYTFGPNFRNEGMDDEHLQEFYDIEWYWAYANYRDNMELVKKIFLEIANGIYGKTKFSTRGHTFDLSDEWEEIDFVQVIKRHFSVDIFKDSDEVLLKALERGGMEGEQGMNRQRMVDSMWKTIRATVSGPAFLVNHPVFVSPLAKVREENTKLTERFQVIIAGSELGNGYSEINDPLDQLERFKQQQKLREKGDEEAQMLDLDFVEMLEYGMPPTSGYGQSERIFWFMEDISGREGTFFPQMKSELEKSTKTIFKEVLPKIKKE